MEKTSQGKKARIPIITIKRIDYDPVKQDVYGKRFMTPLIEDLLRRLPPDKTK